MGFYEQISKYYDYIFPTGEAQLKFIKETVGEPGKKVLDVACGSGGYSLELAKAGFRMTASDLDDAMVSKARDKAHKAGLNINILQSDMQELEGKLKEKFDCIFCIGNSIVHLGSTGEIQKALSQMYNLLEDSGSLVLQIINYDRVIKFGINELPLLKDDSIGLEFIRKYEKDKETELINFNTILTINNSEDNVKYENSIKLFPLMSSDLQRILQDAGFNQIQMFGDFNGSPYNENSFMLVVKAKK
ncbi:MAG: methyltransferase type 11 [Clostridiales bacterium]|jgi:2-polyprenyl-3-methyl-5-hydroxy-6-metoxy-1,4-benzoquinol methylase|nr:methyltransferase type 11 [Clostridiales bacterium]